MLHCQICHHIYRNAEQYNSHLKRKTHQINETKYETIYIKDKDLYKTWKLIKKESNTIRQDQS